MWPFSRLSLFWRIFLWFWLAMALMVVATFFSWMLSRDGINFHKADRNIVAVMDKLAYVLESDMPKPRKKRVVKKLLNSFAPPMFRDRHPSDNPFKPYYLIDEQLKDRNNELAPEAAIALIKHKHHKKKGYSPVKIAIQGDLIFIGPKPVLIDGKTYQLFIAQHIGRFKGRMLLHILHSVSWWQFVVYFLLSGILCFGLAWSLTRPIKVLQSASRKIANGEPTSAKQKMGQRRDEFYHLADDFDKMSSKILNTINSQKQLLSDVSHELRSPLTRIQITLGLLDKELGNGEGKHIERIERECQRMDEMIGQLLNIAALERGQVYEEEQAIQLNQLIDDILKDASFEATEKQIAFEINKAVDGESLEDETNSMALTGYYHLLYSAIENIVRNAIRYSPAKGTINISLTQQGNEAVIAIADQGEGVDQMDLDNIFKPFFRTDQARAREQGGAGLGLAISCRAIKAHGGRISAEINHPHGLLVVIQLPLLKQG